MVGGYTSPKAKFFIYQPSALAGTYYKKDGSHWNNCRHLGIQIIVWAKTLHRPNIDWLQGKLRNGMLYQYDAFYTSSSEKTNSYLQALLEKPFPDSK